MDYKMLGERIRIKRKRAKFTQESLAEMVGCSVNFISQIERGKSKMSVATLSAIADTLKVSMDSLMCREFDNTLPADGGIVHDIQVALEKMPPNKRFACSRIIEIVRAIE